MTSIGGNDVDDVKECDAILNPALRSVTDRQSSSSRRNTAFPSKQAVVRGSQIMPPGWIVSCGLRTAASKGALRFARLKRVWIVCRVPVVAPKVACQRRGIRVANQSRARRRSSPLRLEDLLDQGQYPNGLMESSLDRWPVPHAGTSRSRFCTFRHPAQAAADQKDKALHTYSEFCYGNATFSF